MAYRLTPEGIKTTIQVPDLKQAQKIVGGYVEVVYPRKTTDVIMLVNEDAISMRLAYNPKASEMYGEAVLGTVVVIQRNEARRWGA